MTPTLAERLAYNRGQIDSCLWRARHAIRKRNAKLACELMLSALWLMGVEQ